jgi:ferredoxin
MVSPDKDRRTAGEWAFLLLFYPALLGFYLIYKYPHWLLPEGADLRTFYLFGKSPGFWYNSLYTAVVVGTCLWVLLTGLNRYQWTKKKKPLSRYQRAKFTSILLAQLVGFYLFPFILPGLLQPGGFWNDPPKIAAKAAHVYVYPGFQSWGMAVYLFLVIPVAVWFFGKRYCSWFCSCGNLAETVGVLPWGAKWVRLHTPRGETAKRLEVIQVWVLAFAVFFGVMLLLDGLKLFSAPSLLTALQGFQDFFIDFLFGSVVGIGAYPILGTRVWCRYGCPLAAGMRLAGKFTRSRYAVVPNDKCKGLGLCTQVCPMGIDVASFAHKDKKPILVSFGLDSTPCIGCGGCIDVCPVGALSFAPIGRIGLAVVSSATNPAQHQRGGNEYGEPTCRRAG